MQFFSGILILALGLLGSIQWAGPARADTWYEISSEKFLVYTNADAEFAEGLVEDLEVFRSYLMTAANLDETYVAAIKEAGAEKPFLVYGLKNNAYFKSYTGQENISLSFAHPRGMVTYVDFGLHPDPFEGKRGKPGRQLLFYEYARYFLTQYSSFNYPLWYIRGFAMYLSTFEVNDGFASIGLPHLRAVRILSSAISHHLLPMRYVLGSTREYSIEIMSQGEHVRGENQRREEFFEHSHSAIANPATSINLLGYQAWSLVHFLQSKPEYRQKLVEYLVRLDDGQQFEEAFEEVFGETLKDMGDKINAYTERKLFPSYEFEFLPSRLTEEISIRKLGDAEARFVMAEGKSYFLEQKSRLFALKNQVEAAASTDFQVKANTILAEMEFFTGNFEKARNIIAAVLANAPNDGRANGVMGALLVEDGTALEARPYLRTAILENENDLLALNYLGLSYLYEPEDNLAEGIQALDRAFMIYPQNEQLRFELAVLYALAGNPGMAVPELQTLAGWGSNEAIRARAETCLARIQENRACQAEEIRMVENP